MRPAWAVASAVAATMASRASSAAADSSSTSPTFTWPRRICSTTSPTWVWMSWTSSPASAAAFALCSASRRTSSATTANPLPCLPARAASIAALSDKRFVMSASSRIDAMKPVMRRLTWPSCWTLLELSPTNALRATRRSIASRICVRLRLATSLAAVEARAAPAPSSDTRRDTCDRVSVASTARHCPLFATHALADDARGLRHRGGHALQRFRGLRDGRELASHPLHRLHERPAQVGDMDRRRQLACEGGDRQDVLPTIAILLVMLELQRADHLIPELERDDHETLDLEGRVGDPLVPGDVIDHDGLATGRHGLPQGDGILRRLTASFAASLRPVHERQHTVMQPVDTEVAPIPPPVRQALEPLGRVLETDVGGNHRFHRVDLVQLLGGDRLFDHLLEQEAEEREHEPHQQPRTERPGDHRADENRRGEQRRRVSDHFVPHDHQPLRRLELGADDETEVEEHAAEHEVGERVARQRGQELDVEDRHAVRHVEPLQRRRVHAVGRDERDDLPSEIDPRDAQRLALPRRIGDERRTGDRQGGRGYTDQQTTGQSDERGLCEIGVLAERDGQAAQRHRRAEQHDDFGDLRQPAVVGAEDRDEQRGADPRQRLTVEADEPGDPHPCTAAARSRVNRSRPATPSCASASSSALPTTTPSAARAAAAACAGVLIPNPTATGSRVMARMRRTCASRSAGTVSRAPVTPSREIRYTNPVAPDTAVS